MIYSWVSEKYKNGNLICKWTSYWLVLKFTKLAESDLQTYTDWLISYYKK